MSKRLTRPQPITAPAPESFLPTFDFGAAPKPKSSAPLPPRKPVKLSKRLAAFTFLNLEDIVEEGDDSKSANASVDPLSPANSTLTTSSKSSRFLGFSRAKHAVSPITPTDLPPMSSKAYATLVGGSGPKPLFTPPPSKVIRPAPPKLSSAQIESPSTSSSNGVKTGKDDPKDNPKSLAVDLVSIFSLSMSDETDYNNTRFSFPMPPSFTPRRGSQSPLDPEMSFTASIQSPLSPISPDSVTSGGTDFSFFSPLWSAGFTVPNFPPETPGEIPPPLPEKTASPAKDKESRAQKGRSMRPVLTLIPPAGPPPRDSPPPTPSSTTESPLYNSDRLGAGSPAPRRICPSPDLDPELSAAESTSSIASILLGTSNAESSADEWSDAEEDKDKVNIFGDWALGAPSRSGSIVTITQRAVNAAMHRGSLSTIIAGNQGRNGSVTSDMYDNWEQAIDDIFLASRKPSLTTSRRPSLASIALAASADGAASASTSFDVVEDTAFVMDEEMLRKLMESQFLVPTRGAPAPPSPTSSAPSLSASASNSTTSLASTASASADATPSATSSARSSFEEDRSSVGHGSAVHQGPLTPIQEEYLVLESDPTLLSRPRPARPAPIVTSQAYPPVTGLRLTKAEKRVSIAPFPTKEVTPLVMDRPPPTQSIPDEGAFFSPSSAGSRTPFAAPVDLDSWPVWTSIDDAIASKRNARRPSGGATTIMSKFSDDSIDVSKSRKRSGRTRTKSPKSSSPKMMEEGEDSLEARLRKNGMIGTKVNLSPGSSHTSYTFLGMKKKKTTPVDNATTSPTSKVAPSAYSPVRSPKDAKARSSLESNTSGSSDGKRSGLKRPTLPLELFIRA